MKTKKVQFGFMIPEEWKKLVERKCIKHDLTLAQFGRSAMKTALFGDIKKSK